MLTRRDCLRYAGLGLAAAGLPGALFGAAATDRRLVLVILRGAVDGLAIAAPYGEPRYASLRGDLAIPPPGEGGGLLRLDGMFGLHPALANSHRMFAEGSALLLHAVASPYRRRSHFDGQDVLENGMARPGDSRDGWLNRALRFLPAAPGESAAIAMAQSAPLVLQGANPVINWTPSRLPGAQDETLERVRSLYAQDEFFRARLEMALNSQDLAGEAGGERRRRDREARESELFRAAAKFLLAPEGPRIAVLESGGWDTHANQGAATGGLARRLSGLDDGLEALRRELGPAWDKTVIAVVTEFGRTVRVNGTRGTDHGTAGAALLLGGAVNGGRVLADWPGLQDADLYEGRDLYPTTDIRGLFKGVLAQHWGVSTRRLDREVFPGSTAVRALEGLLGT
jgi:uncharacterized protein (DUF1501 family)